MKYRFHELHLKTKSVKQEEWRTHLMQHSNVLSSANIICIPYAHSRLLGVQLILQVWYVRFHLVVTKLAIVRRNTVENNV